MAVLRGILLFAFFGGLVWFAVSQGVKQEAGMPQALAAETQTDARGAGDAPDLQANGEWAEEDAAPLVVDDPYVIDTTPADGGEGLEDPYGESSMGEIEPDVGEEIVAAQPVETDDRPDWLMMEPDTEQPATAGELPVLNERNLELQRPSSTGGRAQGVPGQLAAPRSRSSELANLVLSAVVSGDPQRLNTYLGGGGDVSESERNLVSTFWSAVTGNVDQARAWLKDIGVGDGVTRAQLDLVGSAIDGGRVRTMEAGFGATDPLAFAMGMVLLHLESDLAYVGGRFREASEALSDLLQLELDAPWRADRERLVSWGELLNNCQGRHRLSPLGDWASFDYEVQSGDNLIGIRHKVLAQRPGMLLCTGLLEEVNDLGEYLQPGKVLRIPTTAPNVLVDLDARTLLYRHGDEVVAAWIVGVGREGHETPEGTYIVGGKQKEPSWMPLGAPARPFGHPDNPLGTRWISWDRDGMPTSYGFHGTSDPSGVGGSVSKGCIRMYNRDVEVLYELLPTGATIIVQH